MSSTMVLMILSSLEEGDMTDDELRDSIPKSWRDDDLEASLEDACDSDYVRRVIVDFESKCRITEKGRKYLNDKRSCYP